MRIVMIGPFAWSPKGTVSARAFLMARALVERGHQVTILMPPYDNPCHAGYQRVVDGVQLVNSVLPSWGDSLRARVTVPVSLARRAKQLKPDLVHVFKPIGYSGLTGLFLRLDFPRLPIVLDSDDWDGRGGWADLNPYPRYGRCFFTWQERWMVRQADVLTVASRALETRMWGRGVRPERVHYIPNGPNPLYRKHRNVPLVEQRQLRQELGAGDAPLALYIGHISYVDEVNLIAEALPEVINAVRDLRVVIMGAGPGIPQLRELALRLGISRHFIFTGWVSPERTPVYLAAADLALYPYRDTLVNRAKSPSKITAYMAMGKPIVASAVGDSVEYLDGGRAGLLVEPGDALAFAEGIVALLRDPDRAAELGRRAERRVWQRYDWTRQVGRLEEAYQRAVNRGKG